MTVSSMLYHVSTNHRPSGKNLGISLVSGITRLWPYRGYRYRVVVRIKIRTGLTGRGFCRWLECRERGGEVNKRHGVDRKTLITRDGRASMPGGSHV